MTALWGKCYRDGRKKEERRERDAHPNALAPTRRGGEPRFTSALIAHVDHFR
jgi:hypothetical protein